MYALPPIKDPLRKRQPLNKGNSLDVFSVAVVHFNLQERDNLSTKDKMAGFKVSFIWRFHYNRVVFHALYTSTVELYNTQTSGNGFIEGG